MIAITIVSTSTSMARDTRHLLSIAKALRTVAAEQKVDPNVTLVFGDSPAPPVAKKLGTYVSNKKTNAFNKSDMVACEWAFLSAVLSLQERARRDGGDAVINIRSYNKKNEISNRSEYMCGAGTFVAGVAGVAFRGDVVKLRK